MKIRRTIPPSAAPVTAGDLLRGIGAMSGEEAREEVERQIREHFGTEYVFLVSSGKAALAILLRGLSALSPRKKVLIPAYTCWSVPSAVLKAGLAVDLCDVDPDTLDFDFGQLEQVADREALCVVSTHLFGVPSDVARIRRICGERGIFLVEDAAQAMGVGGEGGKLGALGDAGFFSMGRGKNVTCGSGGAVVTNRPEIAESIRPIHAGSEGEPKGKYAGSVLEMLLMKAFLHPSLYWLPSGMPFLGIGETRFLEDFPVHRMSGFRAGVLRTWRERLKEHNLHRTEWARRYAETLALKGGRPIYSWDLPLLRFPVYMSGSGGKESAVRRFASLGVSPMYPRPVNRIDELRDRFAGRDYPGADRIAKTLVTLPTHPLLDEADFRSICAGVEECGIAREGTGNALAPGEGSGYGYGAARR